LGSSAAESVGNSLLREGRDGKALLGAGNRAEVDPGTLGNLPLREEEFYSAVPDRVAAYHAGCNVPNGKRIVKPIWQKP
jgi:hypothetical protein